MTHKMMTITGERRTRTKLAEREASTGGLPLHLAKPIEDAAKGQPNWLPPAFGGKRATKGKRRKPE